MITLLLLVSLTIFLHGIPFLSGEVLEIPNFGLYHVIPLSLEQITTLNRFRTSDSGMIFINGIGIIGEVTEVLAMPEILEYHSKDLLEMQLHFDLQFSPVTIQMMTVNNVQLIPDSGGGDMTAFGNTGEMSHGISKRSVDPMGAEEGGVHTDHHPTAVLQTQQVIDLESLVQATSLTDNHKRAAEDSSDLKVNSDEEDQQPKPAIQNITSSRKARMNEKSMDISSDDDNIDPTAELDNNHHRHQRHFPNQKFVEIRPVVEPDVYSGVFLKITSASKDHIELDSLTYGVKVNSTMGNPYLCLSSTKSGDDHDFHKQWMFEETEVEGHYLLRNKKMPSGYVTWEDDEEQYLVIEQRRESHRQFKLGGHLRKNVLFNLQPRQGRTFELKILGRYNKNMHIVIDPIWEGTTGCYLLRRTTKEASNDGDNLQFLFKIKRPMGALKIVGILENLKYHETVPELFDRSKRIGTVMAITTRAVYNHADHNVHLDVEDMHERRDRFHFQFATNDSMTAFDELWVYPGLGIANSRVMNDSGTGKPKLVKLEKIPGRDTMDKFKYIISSSLHVPPWTAMQYTVVFGWLENLKMLFEADLKIFGKTDRLTKATVPRIVPNQIVNFQFVRGALKSRGFNIDAMHPSQSLPEFKLCHHEPSEDGGIATMHTVFVHGSLIAKTLGIIGDVEVNTAQLSSNITTNCQT